MLAVKVWAPTC